MIEFDIILKEINRITPTQWKQMILLVTPCMFFSLHMAALVFLGAPTDYNCAIPGKNQLEQECGNNWTDSQTSLFLPKKKGEFEKCRRYNYPNTSLITCGYCWPNGTNVTIVSPVPELVDCTEWNFDTSEFKSTVFTEFNLVCEQNYKRRLSQAIFMTGVTLGCFMWGQFSDRFGRRRAIALPCLIGLLFAVSAAFAKSFMMFTALRFFVGFCLFPPFPCTFVLATEFMAPKYRVWIGQFVQSIYALGFCLLALLGYYIRYWRTLQLVITAPIIIVLIQFWFIYESPRWLIATRQYQLALAIVKKIMGREEMEIKEEEKMMTSEFKKLQRIAERPEKDEFDTKAIHKDGNHVTYTVADLLRTPNLRMRSLIMFYCWCVVSATYYGLTLNAADLGGSPFINLFISGILEVPSCFLSIIFLEKWGRLATMSFTYIVGGVSCIAMLFVPKEMLALNIVLSMCGKFCSTAAFSAVYIYAAEIYPTQIRNIGIGTCGSWARIGGILAPFIAMLDVVAKPVPYVVFGIMSAVAGILILLLPETLGIICLPESIEEGESFGTDQTPPLSRLFCKKKGKSHLKEEPTLANFDDLIEKEEELETESKV